MPYTSSRVVLESGIPLPLWLILSPWIAVALGRCLSLSAVISCVSALVPQNEIALLGASHIRTFVSPSIFTGGDYVSLLADVLM